MFKFLNAHILEKCYTQENKLINKDITLQESTKLIRLDNIITIKHFFSKSWEDWLWKVEKRGNPTNGLRKVEGFFHKNPDMYFAKKMLMKNTNYDTIDFDKLQKKI